MLEDGREEYEKFDSVKVLRYSHVARNYGCCPSHELMMLQNRGEQKHLRRAGCR